MSDPKKPVAGDAAHPETTAKAPGTAQPPVEATKPPAPAAPAQAATAPAAGAKPTHVTCTIDGERVTVPVGTNLVEAAATVGIEIPFYCYHKGLSIAANCRMCLVQVSNAPPNKLVPACQTPAVEGQKVDTRSHLVKEQQRAVLEFLLLNHPVDCAICDQAGECKLQDYYMEYDHRASRLDTRKWMKNKRKVLGPLVVLDQERCILCTRCVRFMQEVAKDPVLGVFGRGTREVIDVFPGKELTSNYAGNTVDLCPVGALLNRDMRFRARAYFLTATPSICTGCERGCNTYLDHFQYVPYRYRPRENLEVNKYWMCDLGRLTYHALYDDRVERAKVGKGAAARGTGLAEAARLAATELSAAKGLAFVVSPVLSLEDALAVAFLAKTLKVETLHVSGRPSGPGDDLLLRPDRNPNRKGVEAAAKAHGLSVKPFEELLPSLGKAVTAVAMFGGEVPVEAAKLEGLSGLATFVAASANVFPHLAGATVLLPLSTHAEEDGTFVNFEGRFQRVVRAYPAHHESRPAWAWAVAIARELGAAVKAGTAREVFHELGAGVAPAGFSWDAAPSVAVAPHTPLPGGTVDGRPPGWRELVPLRTSSLVPGAAPGGN